MTEIRPSAAAIRLTCSASNGVAMRTATGGAAAGPGATAGPGAAVGPGTAAGPGAAAPSAPAASGAPASAPAVIPPSQVRRGCYRSASERLSTINHYLNGHDTVKGRASAAM